MVSLIDIGNQGLRFWKHSLLRTYENKYKAIK